MLNKLLLVSFLTIVFLTTPNSLAEENKIKIKTTAELIQLLQEGGLVVYMPHGQVHRTQFFSSQNADPMNCGSAPVLSAKSESQMRKVGETIADLQLPINQVFSSPYCQTRDTAKAVFGKYQIDPQLAYSNKGPMGQSSEVGKYLKQAMLETDPAAGNTVFVGHSADLISGLGIWPKPAGVAVVFKKTENHMILLGMIKPDDWQDYYAGL